MNNYNEMIGKTRMTDAGEYTIIAEVGGGGCADAHIDLYVGRAADGHHDLIADDNASMWVVGDENDAERNRDQWDAIAALCDVAPVIDEVREIDADLADWLAARHDEATRTIIIYKGDCLPDDGCPDGAVVAPSANLDRPTIEAIWDELPDECVLAIGLGGNKEYAHFTLESIGEIVGGILLGLLAVVLFCIYLFITPDQNSAEFDAAQEASRLAEMNEEG